MALVFAFATGAAAAHELGEDRVTLRGFGTIGVTTHDAEGIEFRRNVGQARGARAHEVGFDSDTLAGLQVNATFNPRLTGVAQAITRMSSDGDWRPRLTQAFVRYSPDESWVIRAGRFGFDIYLLAESRQVGHSYFAVRPSQDFYGILTNDEVDGIDVAWTTRLGRGLVRTRFFGGQSSDETAFPDGDCWKDRSDAIGVSVDYTYGALKARAALVEVKYGHNPELQALGQALIGAGAPDALDIGARLVTSKQRSRGVQLGVAYDGGPLQAQALYGQLLSDSIAGPNVRAWLTQVGYRVGDFTPFASFSGSRNRDPVRGTGLPDAPETRPLNDMVLQLQDNMRATQDTRSIGVRWDFAPRWDFKLQADFMSIDESVLNLDRRADPRGGVNMTVLTAAVDFVF